MRNALLWLCSSTIALVVLSNAGIAQQHEGPGPSRETQLRDTGSPGPNAAGKSAGEERGGSPTMRERDAGDSEKGGARSEEMKPQDMKGAASEEKSPEKSSVKERAAKTDKTEKSSDKSGATGTSEGTVGSSGAGKLTTLPGEQKTKVVTSFRSHKSESVKSLNVTINVGTHIPRDLTLYAVPEDVVVIVPDYRRYKYFIYEDKVVIVDPVTYEIVDVLILA